MIPKRLFEILRLTERNETSPLPPTAVYNEGWMLRLTLDAFQSLAIKDHPLEFLPQSRWYSEALLGSRFRPRARADALGEGFTNADGVIGQFEFSPSTKAGLVLTPGCKQFVVLEAKMFSGLSHGTKNAPGYNQAARNVACMAEALSVAELSADEVPRVGFFVIAPTPSQRGHGRSNLEELTTASSIRSAVRDRISTYSARQESAELTSWEEDYFLPLIDRLDASGGLKVLSWEECIERIRDADKGTGDELHAFYERCLTFRPIARAQDSAEDK